MPADLKLTKETGSAQEGSPQREVGSPLSELSLGEEAQAESDRSGPTSAT